MEFAPRNIEKQAIAIGKLTIFGHKPGSELFGPISMSSTFAERCTVDIYMNSEGKIFVSDEEYDNMYYTARSISDFLLITPTEHFFQSYILSFPYPD
ncbi:hypothetical protein ACFP81_15040 [Deinococcus lacus]|uniref:Uncharacterized protein n=1 Tax=Deinococcus lacus TaxID=392561 RepID=A0ABW1YHQ1_9DEIO